MSLPTTSVIVVPSLKKRFPKRRRTRFTSGSIDNLAFRTPTLEALACVVALFLATGVSFAGDLDANQLLWFTAKTVIAKAATINTRIRVAVLFTKTLRLDAFESKEPNKLGL